MIVTHIPEGEDRENPPKVKLKTIRQTASKYGIDPDVAVKVAKSEGGVHVSGYEKPI